MSFKVLPLPLVLLMFAHLCAHQSVAVLASLAAQSDSQQQQQQNVVATANVGTMKQGQTVIAAVMEGARGDFILYKLSRALNTTANNGENGESNFEGMLSPQKIAEFESLPAYEDFEQDLLHWLKKAFNVKEFHLHQLLRTRTLFCTEDDVCYNSADIAHFCCPF